MTLPELLSRLTTPKRENVILVAMYYLDRYKSLKIVTSDQVREALKVARVPKASAINVSDYLSKAGGMVDSPGLTEGKRTWKLTQTGTSHVLALLGNLDSTVEENVSILSKQIESIEDPDVREYLTEARDCVKIGAHRAAVVFAWVGAVRLIQLALVNVGLPRANDAILKHYQKAKTVKTIDDFEFIQEATQLLAARDVEIFDKGEAEILKHCLDVRNKCGHPGKYKPGPKKLASIIEDLVSVVYSRY